jgi:hypothetical protein
MKLNTIIAAVMATILSSNVWAEGGGDKVFDRMMSANTHAMQQYATNQGKRAPVIKEYEYGMNVDVVKVVSVVRPQKACSTVPAAMTYEDSQGQLNTLKYTVAGECRKHGG